MTGERELAGGRVLALIEWSSLSGESPWLMVGPSVDALVPKVMGAMRGLSEVASRDDLPEDDDLAGCKRWLWQWHEDETEAWLSLYRLPEPSLSPQSPVDIDWLPEFVGPHGFDENPHVADSCALCNQPEDAPNHLSQGVRGMTGGGAT